MQSAGVLTKHWFLAIIITGRMVAYRLHASRQAVDKPPVAGTTGGFTLPTLGRQSENSQQQADNGEHNHKDFVIAHVHHLNTAFSENTSEKASSHQCLH